MAAAIKLPQLRVRHSDKPAARQRNAVAKGATRKAVAKRQSRGDRWLNRILILLAVGMVSICALQAAIALQRLPVERITVTGELAHTQAAAVQDMVYPALVGGFLGADLTRVRLQLEALPWIHEARVRRVWPKALEIHVVEQLPIARWGKSGFLNHEGEVFRPSQLQAWQSLPILSGPEGQAPALMRNYQRLVDVLKPMGLSVSALSMDDRAQMTATLSGGQVLKIGGVDFLSRINRFKRVYRAELAAQMQSVKSIDLRYQQGVAVAFKPVAEERDATNQQDRA